MGVGDGYIAIDAGPCSWGKMEMARRGEEEEEEEQEQEEGGEYGRGCGSCGRVSGRVSCADAMLATARAAFGGCVGHYTPLTSLEFDIIRWAGHWVII